MPWIWAQFRPNCAIGFVYFVLDISSKEKLQEALDWKITHYQLVLRDSLAR